MLTHAIRTSISNAAIRTRDLPRSSRTHDATRGRVGVILNPTAGQNLFGRSLSQRVERTIESTLIAAGYADAFLVETRKTLDGVKLARRMAMDGIGSVIAVGGDGTINEVVTGLMSVDGASRPTLGVVSTGTGRGFAQSLRLPASIADQVRVLQLGRTRTIDVLSLNMARSGASRYVINECEIGFGAEVVRRTVPALKRLGGTLAFGLATLSLLPTDYFVPLEVQVGDDEVRTTTAGEFLGLIIANGDKAGGAMTLAAGARIDDGLLDAVIFRRMPLAAKLRSFIQLYKGSRGEATTSTVRHVRAQSIRLRVPGTPTKAFRVAVDGELLPSQHTELELTLVPNALRVYSL